MALQLTLPPGQFPTIQPYSRFPDAVLVGSPIVGVAVAGRATLYNFEISGLADTDYTIDMTNPVGRFLLRKSGLTYLVADEWWQLDYLTDPAKDPGKVLVHHNYGSAGRLTYTLAGVPIADTVIEAFLYTDYMAGRQSSEYRIADSRQRADGSWTRAFYLDPQIYAFRFYRNAVAGPDTYRVVVSFTSADITVTLITPGSGSPSPITLPPLFSLVASEPKLTLE